jgi:8-oxo-dGTP diphosphatase
MFSYEYPHPAVATDIAVFTLRNRSLSILLIRRGAPPYEGYWAMPGGFLGPDEDLDACAMRELREETGVETAILEPFGNFSAPDRDPRERIISVAYLALINSEGVVLSASTDAAEARWFAVDRLPELAFDHEMIIEKALQALRSRLFSTGLLLGLLPARFSLSALQEAYEAVVGEPVDKRNFRKKVEAIGLVRETDEVERGRHRPARLFERASERVVPLNGVALNPEAASGSKNSG